MNPKQEHITLARRGERSCFLCKWIVQDYERHGYLTGWPENWEGMGIFPIESKARHLDKLVKMGPCG